MVILGGRRFLMSEVPLYGKGFGAKSRQFAHTPAILTLLLGRAFGLCAVYCTHTSFSLTRTHSLSLSLSLCLSFSLSISLIQSHPLLTMRAADKQLRRPSTLR